VTRLRLASRSDTAVLDRTTKYRRELKRYMSERDADKLLSAPPGEFAEVDIRPEDQSKVIGILYRRNAEMGAS